MKKTFFNFLIIFIIFFNNLTSAEEIQSIKIMGNERISKETILLFSKISKNSKITNKNQLNDIFKNLYETNFFSDIKVNFKKNVLTIKVEENPIIQKIEFVGIKSNLNSNSSCFLRERNIFSLLYKSLIKLLIFLF